MLDFSHKELLRRATQNLYNELRSTTTNVAIVYSQDQNPNELELLLQLEHLKVFMKETYNVIRNNKEIDKVTSEEDLI